MENIKRYFEQMTVNKIVKILCLPDKLDNFLSYMFDCFERINSIEGEIQNDDNERTYILSSIIIYFFNNLYNIILETKNGNIMGINNNDRFNNSRYVDFDIKDSKIFKFEN